MKKLFLLRDNLFATVFVFLCLIIFSFSFIHIGPLNPLGKAIADFDFADLVFKHRAENPEENKEIILVNIANNRADIASQIKLLNHYEPKVIALDAWFSGKGDEKADSALAQSLSEVKNLVMGSQLVEGSGEGVDRVDTSYPFFSSHGSSGFLNLVGSEEKTIRWCVPEMKLRSDTAVSLAASILKSYDQAAYDRFMNRRNETQFINYRYTSQSFQRYDLNDLSDQNKDLRHLKDKIVIIGQLGENLQNSTLEDLHFTPFNPHLSGRSNPDHYGAYIHANIVAMALDDDFVNEVPVWLTWIISILICYLHMVFFIHYYVEKHIWFHLVAKVIQLITSVLIVGLALYLLNSHNIKIHTGYILAPVILSVDLLYFYDGLVKWMNRKFGYKTYFMSHDHHYKI